MNEWINGLPPVGTVCEAYWPHDTDPDWYEFETKYIGESHVIAMVDGEESHYSLEHFESRGVIFRPIRTPEQIAAEEREKAIEEMWDHVKLDVKVENALYSLYSAGYRKQPTNQAQEDK